MEKIEMGTPDGAVENIEKIAELFPQVMTEVENADGELERAVDFDALRDLLGDVAEGQRERYQFTWPGKREAKAEARRPIYKTMIPEPGKSKDWDTTENLYIEGDNLDALKILKETYAGKVKLIYIDPPYNTGNDFIYNDDFELSDEEYDSISGDYDEYGDRLVQNTTTNGRFHSWWCSMMYSRLQLARELLAADGVIYISIDNSEYENLKKICDEVFSPENYQATFDVQVRYGNKSLAEAKPFKPMLEYVLIYSKNMRLYAPNQPVTEYGLDKFHFSIEELTSGEHFRIGNQEVEVFKPGQWSINKEASGALDLLKETWISGSIYTNMSYGKVFQKVVEPRIATDGLGCLYKVFGRGDDGLGYRYYTGPARAESTRGKMYSGVPADRAEAINRGEVSLKKEPIQCFADFSADFGNIKSEGGVAFNSGKKPVKFLKLLLGYFEDKNALVMDFFSGSASTAHAVMQKNAEDNGNRHFIMVQIPERISEKNKEAGQFESICDLGEERIRCAAAKIANEIDESNKQLELGAETKPYPDLGFRVLRIDSSNFKDFYLTPDETAQKSLFDFADNVKEGRSDLDLLFEVLPKLGIPYSAKIEERMLAGRKVFFVDGDKLAACFDANVGSDTIEEMAKAKPWYAVIRDSSMVDDATHANYEELFRTYSPDTVPQVI